MTTITSVTKLYKLADVQEKFHLMMTPQLVKVLLTVYKAGKQGVSVSGIEKQCKMTKATASRIARQLSDRASATKAGFGIAEWVEDPTDMRIKYLRLKPTGKALVERMVKAIED